MTSRASGPSRSERAFVTQVHWLGRIVRGDLGTSIFSGLPVSTLIAPADGGDHRLTLFAMLISVGVGVPLGRAAAVRRKHRWSTAGDAARGLRLLHAGVLARLPARLRLRHLDALAPVQGYRPLADGVWPFPGAI